MCFVLSLMSTSGPVCGKMQRFVVAFCALSVVHFLIIILALTKDCAEAQQISKWL